MEKVLIDTEYEFEDYKRLLQRAPEATIYHTREFLDLIASHLNVQAYILALKEKDKIIGAIPLMLKKNSKFGNVINSSPFFGSYGGIIAEPNLLPLEKMEIKKALIQFFKEFAIKNDCILSTMIISPFDRDQVFYLENVGYSYRDYRIAQVTIIPPKIGNLSNNFIDQLLSSSCRRAVRKAEKKGVEVKISNKDGRALDEFYEIYKLNLEILKGVTKAKSFFKKAFQGEKLRGRGES